MYPMKITRTRAITEPVHIGNHPMKVNKRIEKREVIGMVTIAPEPLVTISTIIKMDIVNIRAMIIPASVAVVFMKSAIFCRY